MGKIAWIFPGQGAQEKGMGMSLIDTDVKAKERFEESQRVLDFDLKTLITEEEAPLNQTAYTQPALLAVSIILMEAWQRLLAQEGIEQQPDVVAGLSLGEYSALVATGALSFIDAVSLVRKRGLLMEEAGRERPGTMAAVLKGNSSRIKEICDEQDSCVVVANYNSPVQVVISGEQAGVDAASQQLKEEKMRVVPLSVSGAFHSPLMESAAVGLSKALTHITWQEPKIPYITNVTADVVMEKDAIAQLLVDQLTGSVRWQESIEKMIDDGVDTFYEIGPGNTLQGLVKKINRKVKVYNLSSLEAMQHVLEEIKGEV